MVLRNISPTSSFHFISHITSKLPSRYTILGTLAFIIITKIVIDYFRNSKKATPPDFKKWDFTTQVLPGQTKAQQLFYQRLNHFSATTYAKFASTKHGKNFIFFSPNFLTILSIIYAGAPDQLKQRFAQEFGIDANFTEQMFYDEQAAYNQDLGNRSGVEEQKKNSGFSSLLQAVTKTQTASTQLVYQTSNAALIQNDAAPNIDNIRHPFEVMRFENARDAETQANQWVSQKTEGKITDLVKKLNPKVVFILVTTSLFAGKWVHPFKKERTRKANFYNADGKTVSIDTMHLATDDIRYGHFACKKVNFDILELPFHGDVALMVAQPNKPHGHQGKFDYKAQMDSLMEEEHFQNLRTYIFSSDFEKRKGLTIQVPKFTSSDEIDLLKDLQDWDLMKAIGTTNFNGSLVSVKGRTEPITTDRIVSRTLFQMEEAGVQLAAASYSPSALQSCDPNCLINSPFLYFFYDQKTQTILGCGRVLQLEGEPGEPFERF